MNFAYNLLMTYLQRSVCDSHGKQLVS